MGFVVPTSGSTQGQIANSRGTPKGIMHQVYVSIAFKSALESASQGLTRGSLTALIRISDHARESRFFGTVTANFRDIEMRGELPAQKVWEDQVCHQDRGLPKISVMAVNARAENQRGDSTVSSERRRVGRTIPQDELVTGQAWIAGSNQLGNFMLLRTTTRQSHIQVNVRLYTTQCDLGELPLSRSGNVPQDAIPDQ